MPSSLSRFALACVLALGLGTVLAVPANAASDDAEAVVVHAVPDLTVDVYVNGTLTLPDFVPGTITDALPLPAGTYDIVIVAAGGDPAMPAIAGSATLAAGDRVTLVAHLAADGTPTLTPFVDDLSLADRGEGRLIVRHVAAAPAVDVKLERRVWRWRRTVGVLEDLENGQQTQLDVRARRYFASILPANAADAVFGPAGVRVKRGQATIVYAFGDLAGGTFDLLVENRELKSETALLTVVHGVLGLPVDVYVNGALTLPNFQPRTITDPLPLPCGDYDVVIVGAGGDPATPAISGSFTLDAGIDYSLVAHVAADGTPTLSPFVNNLSPAGIKARLTARHTAAAPAVDVRLTGRWFWLRYLAGVLPGIMNGGEGPTAIFPGHYEASVTPAGDAHTVVLGPAPLELRAGRAYFVYAIGSLADGTLDLLVDVRFLR